MVGVYESVVADTDTVDWACTGGAGSDTGLADEVEPSDTGLADGGSSAAGLAGVGAIITDSIDGNSLWVGAGGAELLAGAGLAVGVAGDADACCSISELVRGTGLHTL